jgi:hypothetical protein
MALDPKDYSTAVKARGGITYPDYVAGLATKIISKVDATGEGWKQYFDGTACKRGHVAPRFVKNDLCLSCWLVSKGRDPKYPKSKDRTYYKERAPAPTAAGAPVVTAPAPSPLTRKEQEFLTQYAELRDVTAAATAAGMTRGELESMVSSKPAFKSAVEDLRARQDLPWSREPDPETFQWTPAIEKQFAARLIDTGLIAQVREEMRISASQYQTHLQRSHTFAALIDEATPLSRVTLRERSENAAASGNDRLLKILEKEIEEAAKDVANLSPEQQNAELKKLIEQLDKTGVFPRTVSYRRLSSGEVIPAVDLEEYESTHSLPREANLDLVGHTESMQ